MIPYSKEAKLAKDGHITHEQALLRTYTRREGLALAMPYSMALLAQGRINNSVTYSDGILCYMYEDSIRILDVHGASETEDVINVVKLMAVLGIELNTRDDDDNVGIFRYENGILTMKVVSRSVNARNPILVVIDLRRDFVSTPQSPSRIRKILQGEPHTLPQEPMRIMTNGDYLCCVVKTDDVSAWKLKCYDLSKKEEGASIIALHDFMPKLDKCRFKLLNGWVYAICTNEEGDYNHQRDRQKQLYYNCCRFPIDDFSPTKKPEDFLGPPQYTPLPARLQAAQIPRGSGEFVWKRVCIDLVQDEGTGELVIVESTSFIETPDSDKPYRHFIFPDPKDTKNPWEASISAIVQKSSSSANGANQSSRYSTKLEEVRRHVQPSKSIMDVTYEMLEDVPVLHLYASSTERGVWRFPPENAPHELRELLSRKGFISLRADERSLIVIIYDPDFDDKENQLILVNFDSGINFPGFKHLALKELSHKETSDREITTGPNRPKLLRELQIEILRLNEETSISNTTPTKAKTLVANTWFSTEQALHRTIDKGFRFYPATAEK